MDGKNQKVQLVVKKQSRREVRLPSSSRAYITQSRLTMQAQQQRAAAQQQHCRSQGLCS